MFWHVTHELLKAYALVVMGQDRIRNALDIDIILLALKGRHSLAMVAGHGKWSMHLHVPQVYVSSVIHVLARAHEFLKACALVVMCRERIGNDERISSHRISRAQGISIVILIFRHGTSYPGSRHRSRQLLMCQQM
jgi:hypothetical protein